jgi:hypothetical protein
VRCYRQRRNGATAVAAMAVALVVTLSAGGCGEDESDGGSSIDPTPEKLDGSSSYEFEQDDLERAESASPVVQAYCEGAVSEAQETGCLSHVDEVP